MFLLSISDNYIVSISYLSLQQIQTWFFSVYFALVKPNTRDGSWFWWVELGRIKLDTIHRVIMLSLKFPFSPILLLWYFILSYLEFSKTITDKKLFLMEIKTGGAKAESWSAQKSIKRTQEHYWNHARKQKRLFSYSFKKKKRGEFTSISRRNLFNCTTSHQRGLLLVEGSID